LSIDIGFGRVTYDICLGVIGYSTEVIPKLTVFFGIVGGF